jgi:hypothetical protein
MRKIVLIALAAVTHTCVCTTSQPTNITDNLAAKNRIGIPIKIGQFGGSVEGFETVDNGASIAIRPDTTQLVFGDSGTIPPRVGSDEYNKQKANLEQQLQPIATQMADIKQQISKLQDQLKAKATKKTWPGIFIRPMLEKQLHDLQQELEKINQQRQKAKRGTGYDLQRAQSDLYRKIDALRPKLEAMKTTMEKDIEKQLQDLNNKFIELECQQRRIQEESAQPSAGNLVITNNLGIRIMVGQSWEFGVRGISQGTSLQVPRGSGTLNFDEARIVQGY